MKQYILLDWDGNLAQTLDLWLEEMHETLRRRGVEKSDEDITGAFGQFAAFLRENVDDPVEALAELDRNVIARLPEADLYPDALSVLEQLKIAGKKMALVSTSPSSLVTRQLDRHDLHKYFDVVVTGDDTEKHKPDPEPLEKALELLGGTKEDAVMIGDSDKDLGAGANAGIDTILFFPATHQRFYNLEDLQKLNPAYVVEDFRDILKIVSAWKSSARN